MPDTTLLAYYFKVIVMKSLIIILLVLPIIVMGQTDSLVSYTYIHEVNLTKKEVFSGIKMWIATNSNIYQTTVSYEDFESGEIAGNGELHFLAGLTTGASYKFFISIKDRKYRLKIENIELNTLLGYMKQMYSEKVVQYQKFRLDSLSNVIDSLNKVEVFNLKKSEIKMLQKSKSSATYELSKNLTVLIEPYLNKLDAALHSFMTRKEDF